jgi:hypothetical protein
MNSRYMTGHSTCLPPAIYGTEVYRIPPEPTGIGTVVVRVPDEGGPFWTRTHSALPQRWHQSAHNDHRDMTWAEVLTAADGVVQILPGSVAT